ncbi:MAG: hypothetical protein O2971_12185 [Proteobacteria bacterium]|nr:hypothetical protein [Pseudomonadota bacterium]
MPKRFNKTALARAISLSSIPVLGLVSGQTIAQDTPTFDEIIVTGSRRSANVQDIPINISAVEGATIEELRLDGIGKIAY